MSDIFQEVDEDLRRERLKRVWDRYGIFVIAAAVLIVVVTAGYRGYEAWNTSRQQAAGDAFIAALAEAEGALTAGAAETLETFAADAPSGYAMLARFRAATVYEQAGQSEAARDAFAALARDSALPETYRDLARLRLAQIEIDLGEFDAARQSVATMAENSGSPFNASAQELMGLAAYAADDNKAARRWFTSLRDGATTPPGLRTRARFMLALMTQSSGDPSGDEAGETN